MTPIDVLSSINSQVFVTRLKEPSYSVAPRDLEIVSVLSLERLSKESSAENEALIVQSVLPIPSECRHVLMLDFKTPHVAEKELIAKLNKTYIQGFLFRTTNSYHFYGTEKFNELDWCRKVLSLVGVDINEEPVLDLRHVKFSNARNMAGLRINKAWGKSVPEFVTSLPHATIIF